MMEEEYITNQERLKPTEEKAQVCCRHFTTSLRFKM